MATEAQTVQPKSPPEPTPPEYGQRHVFYSKGENFRVVREAFVDQWMNVGQGPLQIARMNPTTQKVYEFPGGVCVVFEGQDIRNDGPLGQPQDAVQYLRSRPSFNVYFWEEGFEPGRLLPTEQEVFDSIMEATTSLNPDAVEDILRSERETHNRQLVLRMCEKAIERIVQTQQELDAQMRAAGLDPEAPVAPDVAALQQTAAQADEHVPAQETATGATIPAPPSAPSLADQAPTGPPPPPKPAGYDEGAGDLTDVPTGQADVTVSGKDAGFPEEQGSGEAFRE